MNNPDSRRSFLGTLGLGALAADRLLTTAEAQQPGAAILGAGGIKKFGRARKAWRAAAYGVTSRRRGRPRNSTRLLQSDSSHSHSSSEPSCEDHAAAPL